MSLGAENDIIIQIEIWNPWEYQRSEATLGFGSGNVGWESNLFNPDLNINYTAEETGLFTVIESWPAGSPSSLHFFHTVPELSEIPSVREYQERFVEKILSVTLNYPNIIYCMNNETGEQTHIRSMRMFSEEFMVFDSAPANHLLGSRESNEAYSLARPGSKDAVYFPDGGDVTLDLSDADGQWTVRWLDIMNNRWYDSTYVDAGNTVNLKTGRGQWTAVLLPGR